MPVLRSVAMAGPLQDRLAATRDRTLALVSGLSDEAVHQPLDPLMSPLVWDLAHIAAYEDLWAVHRLGGRPLLHEDLAATYDAFETPRAVRGEIELLDRERALGYLGRRSRSHAGGPRPRGSRRTARAGRPPRAPAHRDDAPGAVPRRAARRGARRRRGVPRRTRLGGHRGRQRRGRRRRDGLRLRQRAPAPPRRAGGLRHRPRAGDQRVVAALHRGRRLRAPRVVDRRGLVLEGVLRHRRPARSGGRRRPPMPPSCTSPGSRPMPTRAARTRGSPPSSSGRRRPPPAAWRASGPRGSGQRRSSRGTPASGPTPTASTPRSSSAGATGSCGEGPGPPRPAWPPRHSAIGICPNGDRSSRACGS